MAAQPTASGLWRTQGLGPGLSRSGETVSTTQRLSTYGSCQSALVTMPRFSTECKSLWRWPLSADTSLQLPLGLILFLCSVHLERSED